MNVIRAGFRTPHTLTSPTSLPLIDTWYTCQVVYIFKNISYKPLWGITYRFRHFFNALNCSVWSWSILVAVLPVFNSFRFFRYVIHFLYWFRIILPRSGYFIFSVYNCFQNFVWLIPFNNFTVIFFWRHDWNHATGNDVKMMSMFSSYLIIVYNNI